MSENSGPSNAEKISLNKLLHAVPQAIRTIRILTQRQAAPRMSRILLDLPVPHHACRGRIETRLFSGGNQPAKFILQDTQSDRIYICK